MEDDKKAAHVKVRGSVGAIGFGGDRSFRSDVGDPFRLGGNSVCLLRVSVRSICVMSSSSLSLVLWLPSSEPPGTSFDVEVVVGSGGCWWCMRCAVDRSQAIRFGQSRALFLALNEK